MGEGKASEPPPLSHLGRSEDYFFVSPFSSFFSSALALPALAFSSPFFSSLVSFSSPFLDFSGGVAGVSPGYFNPLTAEQKTF